MSPFGKFIVQILSWLLLCASVACGILVAVSFLNPLAYPVELMLSAAFIGIVAALMAVLFRSKATTGSVSTTED